HDISELKRAEDELARRVTLGELMSRPNRVLLTDRLRVAAERLQRTATHLGVLLCDLDNFKVINDSLGHDAGDRVLVSVADRISSAVHPGDTVARLAADE